MTPGWRLTPRAGLRRRPSAWRSLAARPRSRPHSLNPTYTSRLPLAVYLAGAAMTVALSFVFVLVRDVRAAPPDLDAAGRAAAGLARGIALRALGLLAWVWIVAQGIVGGSSDGEVATLFLWVYGWVGVAIVSRLHRAGLAVPRPVLDAPRPRRARSCARLGVGGWEPADYPAAARSLAGVDRLRRLRLARARRRRRRAVGRCSSSSSATRPSRSR